METLNEKIEFNGATISPDLAEMIRGFQDNNNESANDLLERIGDLMCELIQNAFGEKIFIKAYTLDQVTILAALWETIKSLKK